MVLDGRSVRMVGLWVVTVFALGACGPTQSTIRINEAEVALEKASLVDAATKAPYEFFNASEHLHKAKEEWGFSDFEAAINYAELSKEFAEKASIKAKGGDIGLKRAAPEKSRVPGVSPKGGDADADELDKIK